jgi:hypothetical protein
MTPVRGGAARGREGNGINMDAGNLHTWLNGSSGSDQRLFEWPPAVTAAPKNHLVDGRRQTSH